MTARRLVSSLAALLLVVGAASTSALAARPQDDTDRQEPARQVVRSDDEGVTAPRLLRQVRPQYTREAMDAGISGAVWLEAVVEPDGAVGDVTVVRSLDTEYGLDDSAIRAARQWRFEPGRKDGKPVAVLVTIELTFTLRSSPADADQN